MLTRRVTVHLIVAAICLALIPLAHAQFPNKPVRLVVPFQPGMATDVIARFLADSLTKVWGQQVIVDNRAGGAGVPGTIVGRDASPDGYTITVGTTATLAINPTLIPNMPYDPLRDFEMVNGMFKVSQIILAHASAPYGTLADMVNAAKKEPGKLTWSHPGVGTTAHLAGVLFSYQASINILTIPYKSSPQAMIDLIANRIPLAMDTIVPALPHIKAGRIKALAVTALVRVPPLPDVPTVAESGYPGFETVGWVGLVVPKKTPPALVAKISDDVGRALMDPGMQQRIIDGGAIADPRGAKEWGAFVRAENVKWSGVIKKTNIKLE